LKPSSPWVTAEELHAAASQVTGLEDFGPHDYGDGLAELIASYERDADLTPRGEKVARAMLRGALAARLLSEAGWRAHPEHAQVSVGRPLFVTGLPRTGTTALHRLLTADPAHQGLELWLAEAPQPRPPRDTWDANPVFRYIQAGCERHHVEHPEFMGVHYMAADQVEECWQLLRQSMRSISWECLAHLPSYSAWLAGQDWTGAYRRHRRNLQLIGLGDGRRWVLKNPSHLFALDALLAVYPDALIVQTHRAPEVAIASVCSLAAQATAGWSDTLGVSVTLSGGVGVPLVAHGEVSVTGSASFAQNGSTSVARTFAWSQPVLVPAQSRVIATVAVTRSTLVVPYTLSGAFVYRSGALAAGTVGGTYSGVNSHDLEVTLTQQNLDGTPAARPVDQPAAKFLRVK